MPFDISVPEGSALVTSRPHYILSNLAKEVGTTSNQYFAAGPMQHSASPYSSPLMVVPKQSEGVRSTATDSASCQSRVWIRSWVNWAENALSPSSISCRRSIR